MDYKKMQKEIEATLNKYGLQNYLVVATNESNFTCSIGRNPDGDSIVHVITEISNDILSKFQIEIPTNYN